MPSERLCQHHHHHAMIVFYPCAAAVCLFSVLDIASISSAIGQHRQLIAAYLQFSPSVATSTLLPSLVTTANCSLCVCFGRPPPRLLLALRKFLLLGCFAICNRSQSQASSLVPGIIPGMITDTRCTYWTTDVAKIPSL